MIPNITTGADFGDLITYLVENRDHEVIDLQGVSSVALAAAEMAAVAALSSRAKVKLIHLSFSAAHEDGTLSADRWLAVANRMEHAFGLQGHQRVAVRHRDKTHDHIHVFWCTIAVETGCTPPKQWFLKKGFAIDDVGPNPLTDEQVARVPVEHRARHTYDFILLRRAQNLCRRLEREFGLRELRSPQQAAEARVAGEERPAPVGQAQRAKRIGSLPLMQSADAIREALDQVDWPAKRRALGAIGLDVEPSYRSTSKGVELRGVVIVDLADPGNRMKASQLDTSDTKYGWRKLDERRAPGTRSFEAWWPERETPSFLSPAKVKERTEPQKVEFNRLVERHKLAEADKQAKRRTLRSRQKRELSRLRVDLMRQRAGRAAELEPRTRRQFYAGFQANVRGPAMQLLAQRHLSQSLELIRVRKPNWTEFLKSQGYSRVRETRAFETEMGGVQAQSCANLAEAKSRRATLPTTKRIEPEHAVGAPIARSDEHAGRDVEVPREGISPTLAAAHAARLRGAGR